MHVDVAVGTILGTQPATDAVVLDFDFERLAIAMNGVDGASDQAVGVHAGSATACDEELVEPQSVANQPRHAIMRVGASLGAFVTSCASFQVEHEQTLRQEQTLIQILVGLDRLQSPARLFISPENLFRLR